LGAPEDASVDVLRAVYLAEAKRLYASAMRSGSGSLAISRRSGCSA
jgi:hypothetical protein